MIFVSAIFARATLTAKMALTAKMRELHLLPKWRQTRVHKKSRTQFWLSDSSGIISASSAGPSLGTVQCNCKLYRSVAVISLPGNAWWDIAQQRIFSRFPLPPFKATGDEAGIIYHLWHGGLEKSLTLKLIGRPQYGIYSVTDLCLEWQYHYNNTLPLSVCAVWGPFDVNNTQISRCYRYMRQRKGGKMWKTI
jgi:hypothetical protein